MRRYLSAIGLLVAVVLVGAGCSKQVTKTPEPVATEQNQASDLNNATPPTSPIDSDDDGLSDDYERTLGTDPNKADTDGD